MQRVGQNVASLSKSNIHGNLSQRSTLVIYHNLDKPNLINTCCNGNWLINDQESFNFMILKFVSFALTVNELVEMDAEGTAKMFASLTKNIS